VFFKDLEKKENAALSTTIQVDDLHLLSEVQSYQQNVETVGAKF